MKRAFFSIFALVLALTAPASAVSPDSLFDYPQYDIWTGTGTALTRRGSSQTVIVSPWTLSASGGVNSEGTSAIRIEDPDAVQFRPITNATLSATLNTANFANPLVLPPSPSPEINNFLFSFALNTSNLTAVAFNLTLEIYDQYNNLLKTVSSSEFASYSVGNGFYEIGFATVAAGTVSFEFGASGSVGSQLVISEVALSQTAGAPIFFPPSP